MTRHARIHPADEELGGQPARTPPTAVVAGEHRRHVATR
ncbi:hypothetical protein LY71_12628 [Geodermatophilus tzadiensis]|uniref:Uncharacterized protein n=1 Tax=Geodermatophilus tzadiensis TaxID=1137988 RepID=A0A2T0SRN2_9ACTN|nr:hypothetical protein LY71_12628 [Geodermatophilus tzadiensis]